jgi:hypothetical protein
MGGAPPEQDFDTADSAGHPAHLLSAVPVVDTGQFQQHVQPEKRDDSEVTQENRSLRQREGSRSPSASRRSRLRGFY